MYSDDFGKNWKILGDDGRVVVEGRGLDDGGRALGGVTGLEDTRADEHALGAQLHHHGSIGGGGDATGREQHDGEATLAGNLGDELVGGLQFLGRDVELILGQGGQVAYLKLYPCLLCCKYL